MSERTASAAVRAYRDRIRRALLCVTSAHVLIPRNGYEPAPEPHGLMLLGDPMLSGATGPIVLSVRCRYRVTQESTRQRAWTADTAAYYYVLRDTDDRDILGYHWHPHVSGVEYPHLHVYRGVVRGSVLRDAGLSVAANALRPDVAAAHLPTHMIALEMFVRLLITQFGVRPNRPDWDAVLHV